MDSPILRDVGHVTRKKKETKKLSMELKLVAPKLKSDYSTKPWTFPPVVVISGWIACYDAI